MTTLVHASITPSPREFARPARPRFGGAQLVLLGALLTACGVPPTMADAESGTPQSETGATETEGSTIGTGTSSLDDTTASTETEAETEAETEGPGELGPIALINAFELGADQHDEVTTYWSDVNDVLMTQPGYVSSFLAAAVATKAIPEVRFGRVAIITWEDEAGFWPAVQRGWDLHGQPSWEGVTTYPGLYERIDGPAAEASFDGSNTVFVNAFEVPTERIDEVAGYWHDVNEVLEGQPGYVTSSLYRQYESEAIPEVELGLVSLVVWEDEPGFWAGVQAGWDLHGQPSWDDVAFYPGIYERIR